jgi:hypothetical protein
MNAFKKALTLEKFKENTCGFRHFSKFTNENNWVKFFDLDLQPTILSVLTIF